MHGTGCLVGLFLGICLTLAQDVSSDSKRILRVGNEIKPSSSGVTVSGPIFLLDEDIDEPGVLFAYSAFFHNDNPVALQIWRPLAGSGDEQIFSLLAETRVTPSVQKAREDVYLESQFQRCVPVLRGDRLGVLTVKAPGAVSYEFVRSTPMSLGFSVANASEPLTLGTTFSFGEMLFPYKFAMAGFVDTNYTGSFDAGTLVECPKLLIPDYVPPTLPTTTTAPPPTGAPGPPGPAGPQGDVGLPGPVGIQGVDGLEGATGATGPTGPAGADGAPGSPGSKGTSGPPGPRGVNGVMGPAGQKGDKGPAGVPGPAGPPAAQDQVAGVSRVEGKSSLTQSWFILLLLIWVVIVTVALIVIGILVCLTWRRRRRRMREKTGTLSTPGNRKSAGGLGKVPSWVGYMREDAFTDYSNETVSTSGDKTQGQSEFSYSAKPYPEPGDAPDSGVPEFSFSNDNQDSNEHAQR